ncbi:L-ascorbate metabolism protein UlaG (beta-lactamase superfamily) [Chitinophaga niastensis]|uniref:L-ascorbate metabolism protein UlaG (Beta-lactamase superfamily) n=1 Tax=Chitinophaga niastensis TaxID=536980 RepID=A0A2P8HK70_CHINA|nr:MBL fold metallo-hydrolase [Chitinophaga niastensis]PSL46619.1 L-ascorbate metabolism protein UlaG (beta-lactamase superfamily) [Chitinophaga niastensis]
MRIQFLRNATLLLEWNNKKILVDPMLGAKSSMDPVANAANSIRNPTTDLPINEEALNSMLASLDAIIVTHTHRDHWDVAAQTLLPKDLPLFCQPEDVEIITAQGFTQVIPIVTAATWNNIRITRTGGQHGTGEIGKKMAPVSGFVMKDEQVTLYIAGDTIWCEEVTTAMDLHQPDYVVVNAGAAQFLQGDPITMTAADVINTIQHPAHSKVIAVHMEAINHCYLTREALAAAVAAQNLTAIIPAPGEWIDA